MKFRDFADAQIVKWGDAAFNGRVQAEARAEYPDYRAEKYRWNSLPPDDGTCRECYAWRRFPPPQRHFGYVWVLLCGGCDHAHHQDEVWMA
jgi:hypothetical protein